MKSDCHSQRQQIFKSPTTIILSLDNAKLDKNCQKKEKKNMALGDDR